MPDKKPLTDEQWNHIRTKRVFEAKIRDTWVDDVGGIHLELVYESARVLRLKSGDWQFGHGGRHNGVGTEECPKTLHHHCDDFCKSPSPLELMEAGINPRVFKEQSRA
jgi:hypothetical protein